MELRQLRSVVMLAEHGFNVSAAAQRLHLVQPAVSQHLKQLEEELGVRLFQRRGKRLLGLTEAGDHVLAYARQALAASANITAVGEEYAGEGGAVLRLAATHTQARYVLPKVIRRFVDAHPGVAVHIHQGTPARLIDMAQRDEVDLAICTEGLERARGLVAEPCYRWNRCVVAPPDHPLLQRRPLTLEALCDYPMVTYVFGLTGRGNFSDAFAREGLRPRVVLGAADTDVIKTCVREGMGVGVIADLAYQPATDADLERRDLAHLFPWEVTRIAYPRDKYLRAYQREFIRLFQAATAGLGTR